MIPAASYSSDLSNRLRKARVLAVVTVDDPADAAPLAQALSEGGICAVELTLRSPRALEALRQMRQASPAMLIGAGTVLNPGQVDAVRNAGAEFALAPGFDALTVRHCQQQGFDFIPGVGTASEVQAALGLGCRLLKLFPISAIGGIAGLRVLASPFLHLGVEWIPLGGIDAGTAPAFFAEPTVVAVGGSWIASPALIRQRSWEVIRQDAHAIMAQFRQPHLSV